MLKWNLNAKNINTTLLYVLWGKPMKNGKVKDVYVGYGKHAVNRLILFENETSFNVIIRRYVGF